MRTIEEILVDYFDGAELSPEETIILEKWMRHPVNMELFVVLENMHTGKCLREQIQNVPQQGMQLILQKIKASRNKKFKRLSGYSAAACLTLLLVAGFLYWLYPVGHSDKMPVNEMELAVNKSFARLTLADGQIVSLHADREQVIVADSFLKIENTNNTLIYNKHITKEKIEYNTITIPVGAEYNIRLADGTKVYLNAGSELRFPVTFTGKTREVYLNGEGYFEVAKDSARTFKVHTGDMTAVVLGTSFNVRSYSDQNRIATTLEEGHLKIICRHKEYNLTPGYQVQYDKQSGESRLRQVNTKYYTSWKDGYYWFNETSLEEVMEILAKWYDLNVFYMDDEVKKYEFSGRLKRYDDFAYLLGKFEETGVAEFIINKNVVRVKKK